MWCRLHVSWFQVVIAASRARVMDSLLPEVEVDMAMVSLFMNCLFCGYVADVMWLLCVRPT